MNKNKMAVVNNQRKGVTLLMVVSIIVLFLLMGTTFVVLTNNYVSESRTRSRLKFRDENPRIPLERAFYDLIRGPGLQNVHSPLRGHSILGDMYGYGVTAFVDEFRQHPQSGTANLYEVELRLSLTSVPAELGQVTLTTTGATANLDAITGNDQNFFNGQVLSLVGGPAAGRSFRIIEHRIDDFTPPVAGATNRQHTFVILEDASDGLPMGVLANMEGSRVVINGRAFSGIGRSASTLPNYRSMENYVGAGNIADLFNGEILAGLASVNEPWDAIEDNAIENIFLAGGGNPSFHRTGLEDTSQLRNRYTFRPFAVDEVDNVTRAATPDGLLDPESTANQNFPSRANSHYGLAFTTRPLDVDNDGDGINDSIWMDLGSPTMVLPDGRVVKPLFAPLIMDLDRNINLNAAGTQGVDHLPGALSIVGATGTEPRGMGMGPAEADLASLTPGSAAIIASRYGVDGLPGAPGRETWSHVSKAGWPDDGTLVANTPSVNNLFNGGLFSSYLDLRGRIPYATMDDGNAVPVGLPGAVVDSSQWDPDMDTVYESELLDSPYEVDLLHTTRQGNDDLFMPREFEGLLRRLDPDAPALPQRLATMAGLSGESVAEIISKYTTESFEVPRTPLVNTTAGYVTVSQALQEMIEAAGPVSDSEMRRRLLELLAPEVIQGLPMDLNRPFGDGTDNNANGIVDEHSVGGTVNEATADTLPTNTAGFSQVVPGGALSTIGMDQNNDGTANGAADALSRQIFARHLMLLTWMVTKDAAGNPGDFNQDGAQTAADIDALAQWCINVVDFRDSDSIMTPFEYDTNPFDGWDVDGDPSTAEATAGVVFGVERPDLLISETFGAHIRRKDDLATAGGGDVAGGDDDFDNDMRPEPVCFVELMAPQTRPLSSTGEDNTQNFPLEIYDGNGNIPLGRMAPGNSPVWRLGFTEDMGENPMTGTGRRVYFATPGTVANEVEDTTNAANNQFFYYPDNTVQANYRALVPGGQALIGSSGIEITTAGNNEYRTTFGRRTDVVVDHTDHTNSILNLASTRNMTLVPGVGVTTLAGTVDAVAIPVNRWGSTAEPRSFGISDPTDTYENLLGVTTEELDPDGTAGNGDGDGFVFGTTDTPTPVDDADSVNPNAEVKQDGLHPAFRWVQLQRLANPLEAWDPDLNPYITVDEAPVDLFVFNGHTGYNTGEAGITLSGDEDEFAAHERGKYELQIGGPVTERRRLWPPELSEPPSATRMGTPIAQHHFDWEWFQTLGARNINDQFSDAETSPPTTAHIAVWPEFPWNNRPFVSQFELMNVPMASGTNSNYYNTLDPTLPANRSADVPAAPLETMQRFALGDPEAEPAMPTGNLLPFRNLSNPQFARLMDFVEVPSLFAGTRLYLDPGEFSGDDVNFDGDTTNDRMAFNPPYNVVSRWRYPGKVNVNTIQNQSVWDSLLPEAYRTGTDAMEFNSGANNLEALRDNLPFSPITDDVESSWLRYRDNADPTQGNFFQYVNEPGTLSGLDTTRSATIANMPFNRAANMMTSRSSVFAIWITMAYFEVDADGRIGAEIGTDVSDTVRQKRYRGFWMYDRSIPVAFEPGNNHNVERGILTQSFFEE